MSLSRRELLPCEAECERLFLFAFLRLDFLKTARLIFCSKAMSLSSNIIAITARITSGTYTEKKAVADENIMNPPKSFKHIEQRRERRPNIRS